MRRMGWNREKAKEKFDETAFKHVLRGGVTTMIGTGLEVVLDSVWSDALKNGELWLTRARLPIGKGVIDSLHSLRERPQYFVENTSKDLITGLTYNTISYFSNRLLPSVQPSHLLWSIFTNAVEAVGTKGLQSEVQHNRAEQSKIQAEQAYNQAQENLRQKGYDQKNLSNTDNATIYAAQVREAATLLESTRTALNTITVPATEGLIEWQTKLRKYLKYSNPATILGIDWIIDGFGTLVWNFSKVRKVRKERGGLPGKKVEMPKEEKRWEDRKTGRWEDRNKDKVYYGRSQWNPQKEEINDLGKSF